MSYYFIILSIILFSVVLLISYKYSKGIDTDYNYFLVNRNLGIPSVCMSLLATQLGGGVILGTSDFSYKYGIYGIFYTLGLSLGLIVIAFFGAKQLREKNIVTIAELFEKEYNSILLRKVASIISIISLYGILISLIVGTRKFLSAFGIEEEWILYAFWMVLIVYTVLGGMKAVVYTDVVQIIAIFLIFIIVIAYYVIVKFEYIQFSLDNLLISTQNTQNISFTPYILVPFLYVFIEQDVAQRFFSAKNPKIAYISTFLAGFFLLLFSLIPLIFGIAARNINDIPEGVNVMIFFFTQTSNSFIISIAAFAVLCAIISTGASLLCAISSNLTLDFKKNQSKGNLLYTRIITTILGGIAIIMANYFDDIISTMLLSYEVMVCTLFFPIVASYFKFKKRAIFAYISIFLGLIGFLLHTKFTVFFNYSITKELFSVLVSFLAFPLTTIYTKFIG